MKPVRRVVVLGDGGCKLLVGRWVLLNEKALDGLGHTLVAELLVCVFEHAYGNHKRRIRKVCSTRLPRARKPVHVG